MPINENILDCFPLNNFNCSCTDLYVFVKTPLKSEENSYIEQTDYSKHFPDTAYSLSWPKARHNRLLSSYLYIYSEYNSPMLK